MLVPSLVPAFASAADLSTRSVTASDSAAGAPSVTYEVKFTPNADADEFVLDFCNEGSVPGQTCTLPGGFSTANVASTGATVTSILSNRGVKVVTALTSGQAVDVILTGIHNPTAASDSTHGLYARILTYASGGSSTYTGAVVGSPVDTGGAAISITNSIGVSAAVRESLTFCVASAAITADCGNAASNAPNLVLGESNGAAKALSPSAVSTGSIFTQLSSNAAGGVAVNLKSNATDCGGLKRFGASSCDIGPATTGGFSQGQAKFGVKTAASTPTAGVSDATGTLAPVTGYNDTTYFLNFVAGNGTGITSTYGDPFINTAGAPVNNQNMELTFGASASNNTPAGTYSANLSMIAAGVY